MTARSAANANDFRWCFSFVARCVPLPGGWPGPLMGGGCRLRRRLAPRRQARSGSVRTLPEVGFTALALSLLLKLACAPRAPSASAHAAGEPAKGSGDVALLPASTALARSRGLRRGKGLVTRPSPSHPRHSLATPSPCAGGSAARNDFVHTKSPGFFALGQKRPSRCQGVANGRMLRCYAFLRIAQQPSACCRRRRKEPLWPKSRKRNASLSVCRPPTSRGSKGLRHQPISR